jgi:receptor protein-tyrosine kinase
MFGRKRAHLVERAVERLAQSGELDASAAHLLDPDQPTGQGFAHAQPVAPATALLDEVRRPPVTDLDTDLHNRGAAALAGWETAADSDAAATPVTDRAPEDVAPSYDTANADGQQDGSLADPGPHTLMPGDEGAGQPFVDMTSLFRAGMIDWNRVRSRVSEEFRLVQRQIVRTAFTAAGAEPGFSNLLMITSSIPGEGKSFTALNLAACIARQRDHHVLLIDIDSKRDSFCMALGLGDAPGLLDLAANPELDATQVMARTAIENLSVLPIGIERDLGPELFASKQMTKLIQTIGRRYADRLIVLDAPPTLSTSDPAALAPIVGQVLFVVEAERTQREEVVSSLDLLQACPTITMLLNKVQVQTRYTFGAYSTYYTS